MHARMDRAAQGDVATATPSAYAQRFHYDTILHSPMQLRWLAEAVSIDRIVLGQRLLVPAGRSRPDRTVRKAGFTDADVAKILDDNALRLDAAASRQITSRRNAHGPAE